MTLKAGQPVAVTASEYKFDPKNVTVQAGGKTTTLAIKLHNAGGLAHDLKIDRNGSEVGGTPIVLGDKDAGATVKLAPGSYTFFCSVGDHEQLGMKGTLRVR